MISDPANRFTRYTGEILLAEGLNQYAIQDIAHRHRHRARRAMTWRSCGETTLTSTQVRMLTDWVNAGGNLIALRPDAAARRAARPHRLSAARSRMATC